MLRIAWSVGPDASGRSVVEPGGKLVLARRMTLPEQRPVVVEEIAGSTYVLVRLPYVSDPAVVVQAGPGHPVLHRGQRANGVVLEVVTPAGDASTPAPGQRMSLTSPGTRIGLRFPDLSIELEVDFAPPPSSPVAPARRSWTWRRSRTTTPGSSPPSRWRSHRRTGSWRTGA